MPADLLMSVDERPVRRTVSRPAPTLRLLENHSLRPRVDVEVVVPALNEERRLPATLARTVDYLAAQSWSGAVVVVDNGSTDRTGDVVRRFMGGPVPVHLIGCAVPGKGAAVRRGFATGRSDVVGFMDADLSTPVETLDRVVPLIAAGRTTVIASRDVAEATRVVPQGVVRRVGGDVFRVAARTVLRGVADSQCGFKFFDGPAVRSVLPGCEVDGFSFDLELLARLQRAGHDIVELPVEWTDAAGSTFSPLKHGMRSFADTLRIRRLMATAPPSPVEVDLTDGTGVRPRELHDVLVGGPAR